MSLFLGLVLPGDTSRNTSLDVSSRVMKKSIITICLTVLGVMMPFSIALATNPNNCEAIASSTPAYLVDSLGIVNYPSLPAAGAFCYFPSGYTQNPDTPAPVYSGSATLSAAVIQSTLQTQISSTGYWALEFWQTSFAGSPMVAYVPFYYDLSSRTWTQAHVPFPGQLQDTGVATSSITAFCNGTLSTSTSILGQAASDFAFGTCVSFAFLFVPNSTAMSQFNDLSSTTRSKLPIIDQVTQVAANLTASSTQNLPVYSLNLHDLGIGSTTAIGNILPNFDALSSSTINHYAPAGALDALRALGSAAIWLAFVLDVFFTTRNLFSTA